MAESYVNEGIGFSITEYSQVYPFIVGVFCFTVFYHQIATAFKNTPGSIKIHINAQFSPFLFNIESIVSYM